MTHHHRVVLLCVVACFLSGCQNIQKTLGFSKAMPNAYSVDTLPPLTLPPHYDMRPPYHGGSTSGQSQQSSHVDGSTAPVSMSAGEARLKQQWHYDPAHAHTREMLQKEAGAVSEDASSQTKASASKQSWLRRLIPFASR